MSDLYQILGVTREASEQDIKKAYRKLARDYHPDRNPGDTEAERKFKEVQAAYEVLSDLQRKREYDQFGSVNQSSPFRRGKPFTSVFDDFFNNFMGEQRRATMKGEDILVETEIDFNQVFHGGEANIKFQQHQICSKCNGAGGTEGTCVHCNGAGVRVVQGPNAVVQISCQACGGRGVILSDVCGECQGGYTGPVEQSIQFQIAPGIEHGMTFVKRGLGEPCPTSKGEAGNLLIRVLVKPHPFFERLSGGNILLKMPVNYGQLVFGKEFQVPTLEKPVSFNMPAGTQPDTTFRLKGLGLPIFNNKRSIYSRGDQLVQIKLEIPSNVDGRYAELVKELAGLEDSQLTPLRKAFLERTGEQDGRS